MSRRLLHIMMMFMLSLLIVPTRSSAKPPDLPKKVEVNCEETDSPPLLQPVNEEQPVVIAAYDLSEVLHDWTVAWDKNLEKAKVVKKQKERAKCLELFGVIQDGIEPASWSKRGGVGTIEYNASTKALIVKHHPRIHEQIQGLIQSMYLKQQVSYEDCLKQVKAQKKKGKVLTASLKKQYGGSEESNVMPMPKVGFSFLPKTCVDVDTDEKTGQSRVRVQIQFGSLTVSAIKRKDGHGEIKVSVKLSEKK